MKIFNRTTADFRLQRGVAKSTEALLHLVGSRKADLQPTRGRRRGVNCIKLSFVSLAGNYNISPNDELFQSSKTKKEPKFRLGHC